MESSFLEDLLKGEVNQSEVNQLVGNLENALGSSRPNVVPSGNVVVSAGKTNSVSQANALPQIITSLKTIPVSKIANNSTAKIGLPKANGTANANNKTSSPAAPKSSGANIKSSAIVVTTHQQVITPAGVAAASIHGPRIIKGPKGAVPIAPRLMVTPQQARLLMAARPHHFNPALLQSNLVRMPGGATIPVMPRMPGHPGMPVPPVMNTQIPGIPRGAIISMTGKPDPRIIRMPGGPSSIALTQVKGLATSVPGQVNYRFRQIHPTSIPAASVVNGVSSAASAAASASSANNVTMMRESVKRLKEFFQNLINLACSPNQPPDIGKMVKELVHNLMQGKVSEEEFIEKLQKTLKSDPQPNLVHFLKKTLPHLRETIKKQQMQQIIKSNVQAVVSASRLKPGQTVNTPITGARLPATPNQVVKKNLTIPEQMLQKQMFNTITATTGQTSAITNLMQGSHPRGAAAAHPRGGAAAFHPRGAAAAGPKGAKAGAANQKNDKQKSSFYSGADDDIIDVTCMAGVNLQEESQKILSTGDFMSYQTRSIKDKPILNIDILRRMILKKVHLHGIGEVTNDAMAVISHATEHHMRNILERLTACCMHRNDPHKGEVRYETISDVRNQLRVFEEIDEVERKHRESREREILMRVAKSRSRTEDPEQARLKEKAKQMQQEEEELNRKRAANRTALEAIGGKKKKRKLDEALESLQNASTPGGTSTTSTTTTNSNTNSQTIRTRQNRITMTDYNLVLETEKNTTKSLALYRSHLR
ncbi:transcription initiation factor TFIID subunit 4-like [Clytia hemisphaerica]